MNYEPIKNLWSSVFRRSVGIGRKLFTELVRVLAQTEPVEKRSGRPSLNLENQLCLALSYWREYLTFSHLGLSYGVNESNAYRIVMCVEERLATPGLLGLVKSTSPSIPESEAHLLTCVTYGRAVIYK